MGSPASARPNSDEYAPYYGRYIALVPEGSVLDSMKKQQSETLAALSAIAEKDGSFRYADGKWSIKEVIGHIIDSERVFAYRALRFGRNDKTPLPGYEQDDYVASANFDRRPLAGLVKELESVRTSSIALFESIDDDAWLRRGEANENMVSVRALAFIIAGHELHHMKVLREQYLPKLRK